MRISCYVLLGLKDVVTAQDAKMCKDPFKSVEFHLLDGDFEPNQETKTIILWPY